MTSERLIAVERAGQLAARFFAGHSRAEVVAVFERSLYLQAGRSFVCLGDIRIGDGPINVIVDGGGDDGFVAQSRPGEVVSLSGGIATAPSWRLDMRSVEIWAPPEWPALAAPDEVIGAVERSVEIARSMLPFEGLLPLVVLEDVAVAGAFERLATPRLVGLENWLAAQMSEQPAGEPPVELLGLGPGLTPSGDDALCGVLLALSALGSRSAAGARQRLALAIERESAKATTALSAQFLAAAIEGQGSAVLHDFVGALTGGDTERITVALEKLARVGHSSGLDAAAGVIIAVKAFVAASHPPTRSP